MASCVDVTVEGQELGLGFSGFLAIYSTATVRWMMETFYPDPSKKFVI